MRTQTGMTIRLEDYRPSDYVVDSVHLDFKLSPADTIVTAVLKVRRAEGAMAVAPLCLDGDELSLVSLSIDGIVAEIGAYTVHDMGLKIHGVPTADIFEIEIVTKLDPTANKKLMGLYRTSGNYCTQCEAEGFRRITYYLDRPDILSTFTVRLEADQRDVPLLLSNGNCVEKGQLEHGRHFAVWHDPHPKPCYLFALFAGNLGVLRDRFVTKSGRDVALEIYVEHGKENRAAYAMDALIRSMTWDEDVYGCEYDLDVFMIVAVSDFNMGAMENKGLNIFNDKYVLADQQTATDQDYANIEAIIAHEYFHNWTGNRITCRDWFQLCLKEGLTVFRDHCFSADQRSAPVKRIAEVRALKAHQFPEDNGPLSHPVRPRQYAEINNFYTSTVYEKGSELIRMLKLIVDDDGFKRGMDLYFQRHDGQAATIEQFIKSFEDATNVDLTQFALWYDQPGTPNLSVECDYNHLGKRFTVKITQSQKSPTIHQATKPLHIPVEFGLVGRYGKDLSYSSVSGAVIKDDIIHLRDCVHEIVFRGVREKPTFSFLRGFSAPVTVMPPRPAGELGFLARYDRDDFGRWEALTNLLLLELKAQTANIIAGKPEETSPLAIEIVREIISNNALEPAYRALCLAFPSEADIAREIGTDIDPDAIFQARNILLDCVAKSCNAEFTQLCLTMKNCGAFSADAASAGRRALHNIALGFLCRADGDITAAAKLFQTADNLTDRADSLNILVQLVPGSDMTMNALSQFRNMFADNPIVLDKWFSMQAMVPGERTLAQVIKLTRDEKFSFDNPNRVRALIGTFTTGNATGFNREDGAGYQYLCGIIEKIDSINPQVAARLMTAMRSWRLLEPKRKTAALEVLSGLARNANLSRDLRDIVERTLA